METRAPSTSARVGSAPHCPAMSGGHGDLLTRMVPLPMRFAHREDWNLPPSQK
jgi:hypothetical protein